MWKNRKKVFHSVEKVSLVKIGHIPWIVGCVGSANLLLRCARQVPPDCDLLEVRLDLVGVCGGDWPELCKAIQKQGRPVLLTIRDAREGGAWRGSEEERLALYLEGLHAVSAVDVEIGAGIMKSLASAAHRRRVWVVGSFHDFEATPTLAQLKAVEKRGRRMGADVVKMAAMVNTPADLAQLLAMPANAKGPICVLGMGPLGSISRVTLPCAGSCLAYGSLVQATAPGQMSCRQLAKELARWGARPNEKSTHS